MSNEFSVPAREFENRIARHLAHRLGEWPPRPGIQIVGSDLRALPEWDGIARPVLGIGTPEGTIISVPFAVLGAVLTLASASFEELSSNIGAVFGRPDETLGVNVYRYLDKLVDLEPLGEWVKVDDPRVPAWLRPFNGGVLIVCDSDDQYMAGVGLKLHDEFASEIAVGTEPRFRGRGLARRLVATAARHLFDGGKTATYEHVPTNDPSAAVAIASGFSDSGWTTIHLGNEE